MTKNESPSGKDSEAGNLIAEAERNLERTLRELDAVIEDLKARSEGAEARAKALSADVRKAIQTVFEERHRVDKLDGKQGTADDGLDLDAARAEIGRRLSRLRRSGVACRFFHEPEG